MKQKQSRMANLKSIHDPDAVVAWIAKKWPDATVVWARHDGDVTHTHFVVRWPFVVRWTELACWLHKVDGHEYAEAAGSWRRSVRYLLHLDNPEKRRIPRENLQSRNIDDSELAMLLGEKQLPILESLVLAQEMPLSERYQFLTMERGHRPSEISAALRCMLDLERFEDTRHARICLSQAMPKASSSMVESSTGSHDESDAFSDDFELDLGLDDVPSSNGPDASARGSAASEASGRIEDWTSDLDVDLGLP